MAEEELAEEAIRARLTEDVSDRVARLARVGDRLPAGRSGDRPDVPGRRRGEPALGRLAETI